MARHYPALTFTESVKRTQEHYGSRDLGAKMESMKCEDTRLSQREANFVSERDGFYLASVGENGWPYVQYRGGPKGFLTLLDDRTLGYADFQGNRQYISTGNLQHDNRVALILMDYPNRSRLKVMARTTIHDAADQPDLVERLRNPNYAAHIERVVLFTVEAFDWNCSQHITPRWTAEEFASEMATASPR